MSKTASKLQESLARFLCKGGMKPEAAVKASADSLGEEPIELKPTALEESTASLLATWSGGRTTLQEARALVRRAHPEGAFLRDVAQPTRVPSKAGGGTAFLQESHVELITEGGCGYIQEAY